MDINQAISICFKQKIKVYPYHVGGGLFVVEVKNKGKITRGQKKHTGNKVAEAIKNTYIYLANKQVMK